MPKIELRVAGIMTKGDEMLLVNHRKHGASYWVLPGGHVEFGESLEQALVREMKEELSLDVTVGPLALIYDFIAPERHVANLVFRMESKTTKLTVNPEGALQGAQWTKLADLVSLDLRPQIAEVLIKVVKAPPRTTLYLGKV